jgi:signal peptidase I
VTEATADVPAPAATADPTTKTARRPRSASRTVVEWVVIIAIALIAAVLIKTYLIEAYVIPSSSMSPTIEVGDRVLVDKLSYDFGARPERGNIIVFAKPAGDIDPGVKDLIKRVVGLPGQTIRSTSSGGLTIDGRLISQPWLTAAARADPGPAICSQDRVDCVGQTLHVPPGDYFVMGDNRNDSDDSRFFGPIPGHLIVGRAFVRIWPLSRLHWF